MIAIRTSAAAVTLELPPPQPLTLPTLRLDAAGRIADRNEAFARWVGRPSSGLVGMRLTQVLPCAPQAPMGTQEVARCDCSGPVPCWTASVARALSGEGLSICFVPTALPVEQRDLREAIAGAARHIAMGKLAAGVAHEINNPIACVRSCLQFVAEQLPSSGRGEVQEALQEALLGVERVIALGRDLQLVMSPAAEPRGPVELRAALDAAMALTRPALNRHLRLTCEFAEAPRVLANKGELVHALAQLLLHAAQAMPGQTDPRQLVLTVRPGRSTVLIELADPSRALSDEEQQGLFKPSVGSLGLIVARSQLESFGGSLEVSRAARGGTLFTLALACECAPLVGAAKPRVLVIDDDVAVGRVFHRLLRSKYDVTHLDSGQKALDWLAHNEVDAVLCDLSMPEMGGVAFLRELAQRQTFPPEQVVLVSGDLYSEQEAHVLPNPRLSKPCDINQLEAALALAAGRAP
jgi:CheY-like chemotaxis protein